MSRYHIMAAGLALLASGVSASAQVTYTSSDEADAFVATGSPGNPEGADLTGLNFGGAGILVVAPASSPKGEFQSLLKFDLAGAVALFNNTYGAGQWSITAISLTLTSNYGVAGAQPNNSVFPVISGGSFVIEWLANDIWVEGTGMPNLPTTDGVTYDSLPGLLSGACEILGTNSYVPPGNNIPVTYALPLPTDLVTHASAGGDISFLFYAADNQIGYLFNSYNYGRGNQPLIEITAAPNPVAPVILTGYFTNAAFRLDAVGGANLTYQVQSGSNLNTTNWQTLGTATANASGLIRFDDAAPITSRRFYRLFR